MISFPGMEAPVIPPSRAPKRTFRYREAMHSEWKSVEAEWAAFEAGGWVVFWESGEPYARLVLAVENARYVEEAPR
jgi:hypothetical protein